MRGPVILTTMDFDQPWTLENYLKVGGYQALRKVLTERLAEEQAWMMGDSEHFHELYCGKEKA